MVNLLRRKMIRATGFSNQWKELTKIKLNNIEKVSKAHLQLEIRKMQMSLFT
jgi:hypothetical protein